MAGRPLDGPGHPGRPGGRLVLRTTNRAEDPERLVATDSASREVIQRLMADLIHINRQSLQTEPALAKSWKVSADGRHWS